MLLLPTKGQRHRVWRQHRLIRSRTANLADASRKRHLREAARPRRKSPRFIIGTSPFRMLSGKQRAGAPPTVPCCCSLAGQARRIGPLCRARQLLRPQWRGISQPCRPAPRDRGRTRLQRDVICRWSSEQSLRSSSLAQIRPTIIKTPISIMRSVAVAAEMRNKSPNDRCMICLTICPRSGPYILGTGRQGGMMRPLLGGP